MKPLREAYLAFFPMYEMSRLRFNALEDSANPRRNELHRFNNARNLLDHTARKVTAPNNDTLYSSARLDLRLGPVLIGTPAMPGRYRSVQCINAHGDNIGLISGRDGSNQALRVLVVGPGWQGALPAHERLITADTFDIWLLVRVLVDGPADLPAVARLQDALHITEPQPAAAYPRQRVAPAAEPNAQQFIEVVNEALQRNPPNGTTAVPLSAYLKADLDAHPNDHLSAHPGAHLAAWQGFGLGDTGRPDAATLSAWNAAWPQLTALLQQALQAQGRLIQGWQFPPNITTPSADYAQWRAAVAQQGIGGLEASEALYLCASADHTGEPLHGSQCYRVHLPAGGLPVDGFWSLTVYECMPDGRQFLAANPIDRYAVGDRTPGLRVDAAAGIELLLQHALPSGAADIQHWLPLPNGPFRLMLRAYLPQTALLRGQAPLPRVERLR